MILPRIRPMRPASRWWRQSRRFSPRSFTRPVRPKTLLAAVSTQGSPLFPRRSSIAITDTNRRSTESVGSRRLSSIELPNNSTRCSRAVRTLIGSTTRGLSSCDAPKDRQHHARSRISREPVARPRPIHHTPHPTTSVPSPAIDSTGRSRSNVPSDHTLSAVYTSGVTG